MTEIADPKPFVKWVGGKRQLLPHLRQLIPYDCLNAGASYFEPFVGGGALFFDTFPHLHAGHGHIFLSDTNTRLIATYRAIKNDPEAVIDLLRQYPYEREFFNGIRAQEIDGQEDVKVAAWFIYLNHTCFNGLYRVNKNGQFNAPFGKYTNPTICDADNIRACSRALTGTTLLSLDFVEMCMNAKSGDFCYFDPPYVPLTVTSSFTSYTQDGFGLKDHERLRDTAVRLKEAGVHVVVSNSNSPIVRELYENRGFLLEEVQARRSVNSNAEKRGNISELLIHYRGHYETAAQHAGQFV